MVSLKDEKAFAKKWVKFCNGPVYCIPFPSVTRLVHQQPFW